MQITATTISLTVDDVRASAAFLRDHFGFRADAEHAGDFAKLSRPDAGVEVVFLRRGIDVLPEATRGQRAAGVILAFTVAGLAGEEARLRAAGVPVTMLLREEPWGERLFQVTDPNGVVVQLVEWVAPAGGTGAWAG